MSSSPASRVMLLIDADNVSLDVVEQAVERLLAEHGALHVRRAYCTAESAVKHQAVFKRLGIRPMVNLAAGKNSTDIALAVDALDLAICERPDLMVIASSDSDFAPLVARLREKGCRVHGIGQDGKTGSETAQVYDQFTVLEHHKAAPAGRTARKTSGKTASRAATKAAAKTGRTTRGRTAAKTDTKADTKTATETASEMSGPTAATTAPTSASPTTGDPSDKPPAKTPSRKVAAKKATAVKKTPRSRSAQPPEAPALPPPVPRPPPPAPPPPPDPAGEMLARILQAVPALAGTEPQPLNTVVEQLRAHGLLGRGGSSLKLFHKLGRYFELLPPEQPHKVRRREGS